MNFSIQKLLLLPLVLSGGVCAHQLYGSVEIGVKSDSQEKDLLLRHLGFINYQNSNTKTDAVFDYIIQQPHLSDSSISQLYVEQTLNNNNHITFGRFNRFDNLGYYTLDGLQYQHKLNTSSDSDWQKNISNISINSYAGKPVRTDDIHMLSGDYIVGLNTQVRWLLPTHNSHQSNTSLYEPKLTSLANDISATVGYQALKIAQASQRLNLSLSAKSDEGFLATDIFGQSRQEFNLSSSLATLDNSLDKSEFEDLTLDARFYLNKTNNNHQQFLQIRHHYYNPELSRPTFKQRFYSTYAIGKIALTELAYHDQLSRNTRYRIATRLSNKQRGGKGYGLQGQLTHLLNNNWQLESSIDYLSLENIKLSSMYADISLSPDAYSQLSIQAALQFEDKPLYGKNKMFGLQSSYRYMFNANLFLSFSLELLNNTNKPDDHLGRLYLVYYFDKEQN